ncbi:MAG: helix-turn-helix domain-containing protein [Clostridium sp.]|uniref:helix-turn-helix domain-containing protein n=1 Tax=Clostridium sp. TaxID=1506 RepID=UPI0039EB8763
MKNGEILDKVYKSNLPSRAKQIMFYLINRANAEGTCFPSVRTIARDCGVSERTVQRTMKVLLEAGFVIKDNRYRDNGGQSSNLYKLQIEPENKVDNQSDTNEDKVKEENIESEEEKNDVLESIETITFNDYIEVNETKENHLDMEKETAFNILLQKPSCDRNYTKNPKCNPKSFKKIGRKVNIFRKVLTINYICHGVGDNLYPP